VTSLTDTAYTLSGTTTLQFDDAVARVRATLKEEGFGVLTEIDVQATLKEKLEEGIPPYLILGACNPPYAHRALELELEPELGALLPCNVVIYLQQDGTTRVSAADPIAMLGIVGRPELEPIADEIEEKIERALQKVWAA
jgi:uncharacterized protein (DUF302 family)